VSEEPRRRVLLATLIPLGALALMAVYLWSMSRILLASDVNLAPVIALLFALNILVGAAVAAGFPTRRRVIATMVAGVMVPVLAVGVVGAVAGEREFHSAVAEGPAHEPGEAPAEEPGEEPGEEPAEEPGEEPAEEPGEAATSHTIVAENIQFDLQTITAPATSEVEVTLDNRDPGVPHNFAVYTDESASQSIFVGEIFPGPDQRTETFTTPEAGDYFFRCDVHPNMSGTFTVA